MKITTLDEIIERDVPEELYFKKKDWEKRKYLRTTLPMMCTVKGDDVYLFVEGIRPPQILKQKRTEDEKLRRHRFGDAGKKFGSGVYAEPTGDGYSNTLTTILFPANFLQYLEGTASNIFLVSSGSTSINLNASLSVSSLTL